MEVQHLVTLRNNVIHPFFACLLDSPQCYVHFPASSSRDPFVLRCACGCKLEQSESC